MTSPSASAVPANRLRLDWKALLLWSDVATFFALLAAAAVFGPQTLWKPLGFGLSAIGFPLWMVARYQLGRSFTATAQARTLINTGLYRRFRHPIYYFGALACLGAFVALQIWWLPVVWLTYTSAIQWKRMKREGEVLEAAFGEEFRTLRAEAWI